MGFRYLAGRPLDRHWDTGRPATSRNRTSGSSFRYRSRLWACCVNATVISPFTKNRSGFRPEDGKLSIVNITGSTVPITRSGQQRPPAVFDSYSDSFPSHRSPTTETRIVL